MTQGIPADRSTQPSPVSELDPSKSRGKTYGLLKTQKKCYAENCEWWKDLAILYEGGNKVEQCIQRFMPRLMNESPQRYEERKKAAGYINYLAQVVDYFAGALFEEPLAITPPVDDENAETVGEPPEIPEEFKAFERDADLKGTSFLELLKQVVANALVKKWSWFAIDLPDPGDAEPANLAEEEGSGQRRAYAYEIECEGVLDWREGKRGDLEWAVIHRVLDERETPEDTGNTITEEFTIWRRDKVVQVTDSDGQTDDEVSGGATWERYSVTYDRDKPPIDTDIIPLVKEGDTSFQSIPLLRFELKNGLWVGNLIGKLVAEHYRRRATMVSAADNSMVEIPVIQLGPEAGQFQGDVPNDIVDDPKRGNDPVGQFKRKGFMVLSTTDEYGHMSPEGKAYEFTAQDLKDLKDEIFRVVRQMAASANGQKPQALARSGVSKQEDRATEAIILNSLGSKVRQYGVKIFTTISQALGEDTIWTPHGLDEFTGEDRDELLQEGMQVDLLQIPSKTFKQTLKTNIALKLVGNAPPETKELIRQEIKEGADAEHEVHEAERDKDLQEAKIPPVDPNKAPGGFPPKGKPKANAANARG